MIALCIVVAVGTGTAMYLETQRQRRMQAEMISGGDWRGGKLAIQRYGCGSCHIIPGIDGALGKVGPDLTHVAQRAALAGSMSNHPRNMERWLMHPQKIRPGSGMPEQGVDLQEARDMAAYLYAK